MKLITSFFNRNKFLLLFSILLIAFGAISCRDTLTNHSIVLNGVHHGKKLYRGANNCSACHGINLNGNGPVPSCYSCHGNLWDTDEHEIIIKGVPHRNGMVQAKQQCAECHGGRELKGSSTGNRPSCLQCHEDNWTILEQHYTNINGYLHAEGYDDPENFCADCHGLRLTGKGSAPSCYLCHFNKWDVPKSHSISEHGYLHPRSPNADPFNNCSDCHGKDLQGGYAQSCYSSDCHRLGQPFDD
ncbi:MAG: hypothetical protein OEY59_02450 [Deltaproteobacteria bacterium]|nr:hypothetical protein [Deltaproteobacteria bacterium]